MAVGVGLAVGPVEDPVEGVAEPDAHAMETRDRAAMKAAARTA
jgi:hypothetical protein